MDASPACSLDGSPKLLTTLNVHKLTNHFASSNSDFRCTPASDDDFSDEDRHSPPAVETGNLSKWTNMLHGWQERYFVLKDGVLSYYRCEEEVAHGCRGAIRLKNAHIQPHPYDDCRIDVRLGDCTWYFRCPSAQLRRHWVSCIQLHRLAESGYSSDQAQTTKSSMVSLNSIASASHNGSSNNFRGMVVEIDGFKHALYEQVEKIQAYLDACCRIASLAENSGYEKVLDAKAIEKDIQELLAERNLAGAAATSQLLQTPQASFNEDYGEDDRHSLTSDCSEVIEIRSHHRRLPEVARAAALRHIDIAIDKEGAGGPPVGAVSSPDSSDEGCKTPKAAARTATSPNAGGGIGFFSRFLPFRSGTAANSNAAASKAPDAATTFSNPGPSGQAVSRLQDLGVLLNQYGCLAVDFRDESDLFKSSYEATQTAISHSVELLNQREDYWRRRLERESERRRTVERQLKVAQDLLVASRGLGGPASRVVGAGAVGIRMGPGKAHQRSHSHGGQQSLFSQQLNGAPINSIDVYQVKNKMAVIVDEGGPDCAEGGPDFSMREEHFYDAIDAQIDKIHQDAACLKALRSVGDKLRSADAMPPTHALYAEVAKTCNNRMGIFQDGFPSSDGEVGSEKDGWKVLAKQGEMTIYNRDMESEEGTYLDPLQAVHTVYNVTAREMCEAFWDVQYRLEWEITVDQAPTVVEVCGDDTVLLYQAYKRIWPATQRDSLFWSHMRPLDSSQFPSSDVSSEGLVVLDTWMVVNYSTKFGEERLPPSAHTPSFIRIEVDVEMFCQTLWKPPTDLGDTSCLTKEQWSEIKLSRVGREDVKCRLLYASQINPGGWAPAAIVRAMARREYPHFLDRISSFVTGLTQDTRPKF